MTRLTKDELLAAAEPFRHDYWRLLPPQYRPPDLDPDTFNLRVACLRGESALDGTTPDYPNKAAIIAAYMGMAAEVDPKSDGQEFLDAVIAEINRDFADPDDRAEFFAYQARRRSTRRYRTPQRPMASRAVH